MPQVSTRNLGGVPHRNSYVSIADTPLRNLSSFQPFITLPNQSSGLDWRLRAFNIISKLQPHIRKYVFPKARKGFRRGSSTFNHYPIFATVEALRICCAYNLRFEESVLTCSLLQKIHKIRITLTSRKVQSLEKVCTELIERAKGKQLRVKGPVRLPTKVLKVCSLSNFYCSRRCRRV